jgi:hypothetical protein
MNKVILLTLIVWFCLFLGCGSPQLDKHGKKQIILESICLIVPPWMEATKLKPGLWDLGPRHGKLDSGLIMVSYEVVSNTAIAMKMMEWKGHLKANKSKIWEEPGVAFAFAYPSGLTSEDNKIDLAEQSHTVMSSFGLVLVVEDAILVKIRLDKTHPPVELNKWTYETVFSKQEHTLMYDIASSIKLKSASRE